MTNVYDEVSIVIEGLRSLAGEQNAIELFRNLKEVDERFLPYKIGCVKPNLLFTEETAKQVWTEAVRLHYKYIGDLNGGTLDFKSKKRNEMRGSVSWRQEGSNDSSNSIYLYLSTDFIKKVGIKNLIALIKKIFIWANGVYGYGEHPSQGSIHYTPGLGYKTCLGGITWMAILGEPYVDLFGRETILSAPCTVEEFADNRFMLLTSEEPMEPTPEILERQAEVKKHLGEDAFFRHEEEARRPKRYTMEEVRAGKDLPNKDGYRHPDFSKYIKGFHEDDTRVIYKIKENGTTEIEFMKPAK